MIGAGSTYSPELIHGFLTRENKLLVQEFALMDINMSRLEIVGGLIKRMCESFANHPKITMTSNLEDAVIGADYVVTQFRVGMLPARAKDETIPKKYGYIGQETTGPGGFAKALRTIPEMLKIADCMEKCAPDAVLINFTNPSGIITEAVNRYSGVKVIGLCNTPITTFKKINDIMGFDEDKVSYEYFGLNHLGFIRRIFIEGKDASEDLFSKILSHERASEMIGYPFNKRHALAMGILPVGYLQYYLHEKEKTKELCAQEQTRGELLIEVDKKLLEQYADPQLKTKPPGLDQRGGAWYSEAAVALINSIENDDGKVHVINVMNDGIITDLPSDAVVEIAALVKGHFIKPLHFGALPPGIRGLVQHVKAYESLTVEAAATHNKEKAFLALCAHPFMDSTNMAEQIFNDILEAHREFINFD
jgi:6-phospho-beta-glucosidase